MHFHYNKSTVLLQNCKRNFYLLYKTIKKYKKAIIKQRKIISYSSNKITWNSYCFIIACILKNDIIFQQLFLLNGILPDVY